MKAPRSRWATKYMLTLLILKDICDQRLTTRVIIVTQNTSFHEEAPSSCALIHLISLLHGVHFHNIGISSHTRYYTRRNYNSISPLAKASLFGVLNGFFDLGFISH